MFTLIVFLIIATVVFLTIWVGEADKKATPKHRKDI